MQRDIMIGGILNDIIDNVPNRLPNPLLIPTPIPKQQIVPKQTPKVKQQIVAKQAAVATTSTYDATRTYTREQLDAMSETQLRELLRNIMGSNLAPKKGKDPQVATDVYNAYQRNLTRKGRRLINERKQEPSPIAPGATTANMIFSSNAIAQQLEELKQQSAVSILGAKFKRKLDENKRNKAATKIQGLVKKFNANKREKKKQLRDAKFAIKQEMNAIRDTMNKLNINKNSQFYKITFLNETSSNYLNRNLKLCHLNDRF